MSNTVVPKLPVKDREVYSVSRLNREVRGLLEGSLGSIWLEGELSNLARPASGHWYFSLKDEGAQVRCAMFRQRNARLDLVPRDGMQVLVRARVGLYEPRGEFQLVIEHLEAAGEGELRRRFEALKRQLAAEGLFETTRKRPLPPLPSAIGVVTSATGAAIRDILQVLGRRFPAIPVVVYPVPVQGDGAGEQIATAIDLAGRRAEVDVLIVGRGGGSLEDLWAFNEERVARAIGACPIPVVSAVGHEVDITIADLVADVRAPTPSAAAELVAPDAGDWLQQVLGTTTRLEKAWQRLRDRLREDLAWYDKRLRQLHPAVLVEQKIQSLDELQMRLTDAIRSGLDIRAQQLAVRRAELAAHSPRSQLAGVQQRLLLVEARLAPTLQHLLNRRRDKVAELARALNGVSPLATLERGYAIVTTGPGASVVTDPAKAPVGSDIEVRLARGRLRARVTGEA